MRTVDTPVGKYWVKTKAVHLQSNRSRLCTRIPRAPNTSPSIHPSFSFLIVPLNYLRIPKHTPIFSEFRNTYNFPQIFRILFFFKLFPMLGKILPHIFTELCVPKFAWSCLLKILNTYFLKLFPYAAPLPHHCGAAPPPRHPICHNGNSSACERRTKWIEDKVGSFEIQPETNDITRLTRYSSNIAIYANVHVLEISYRRCREKIYVSNYAFLTLLHE